MTPIDIDKILADFRTWLEGLQEPPPASEAVPSVDWSTIAAQFTALRHDVNLQTKAARAATEQSAEVLQQFKSVPRNTNDATKPLLKTLVDIYDALSNAHKQTLKAQESLEPLCDFVDRLGFITNGPPEPVKQGFLARMLNRPDDKLSNWATNVKTVIELPEFEKATSALKPFVDGIADGYSMSLRRIEKALAEAGLEAMECLGCAFDPEMMEVVELVTSEEPPGTVVEEVRRGYIVEDQVFRFAQVKVAR